MQWETNGAPSLNTGTIWRKRLRESGFGTYPGTEPPPQISTAFAQVKFYPQWHFFFRVCGFGLLACSNSNTLGIMNPFRHHIGLPKQGLYLYRTAQHKAADRHPCFEWDSNPRFQCSNSQDPRLRTRGNCDRPSILFCFKVSNKLCGVLLCSRVFSVTEDTTVEHFLQSELFPTLIL
jgi:hypothetical protein